MFFQLFPPHKTRCVAFFVRLAEQLLFTRRSRRPVSQSERSSATQRLLRFRLGIQPEGESAPPGGPALLKNLVSKPLTSSLKLLIFIT